MPSAPVQYTGALFCFWGTKSPLRLPCVPMPFAMPGVAVPQAATARGGACGGGGGQHKPPCPVRFFPLSAGTKIQRGALPPLAVPRAVRFLTCVFIFCLFAFFVRVLALLWGRGRRHCKWQRKPEGRALAHHALHTKRCTVAHQYRLHD